MPKPFEQEDDFRDEDNGRYGSSGSFMRRKKKKKLKKKTLFRKRRPPSHLTFDYKNPGSYASYLTEEGKIVPARISGLRAYQQRQLNRAVKLARELAIISPVAKVFIQ